MQRRLRMLLSVLPVMVTSFVKWAVWTQAEKSASETREPEGEEENDHREDEEEDDKQGNTDRIRL